MKYAPFIAALEAALAVVSCCGSRQRNMTGVDAAPAVVDPFAVFDSLDVYGEPYRICKCRVTTPEFISSIEIPDTVNFGRESVPAEAAFYFPSWNIRDSAVVNAVRIRYNYSAVINRVLHSYELFQRKRSNISGDDSLMVAGDDIVRMAMEAGPGIDMRLLNSAIPEPKPRMLCERLLRAYGEFNGDDSEDSRLATAFGECCAGFNQLPEIADSVILEAFDLHFWSWYDKSRHVKCIDDLVRLHLNGSETVPDSSMVARLRMAVERERDIDSRAILALELAKWDIASQQLGEIMESGIYTRYLLEVWIAWRAAVQMEYFGPSSFTLIPDNYYDSMRVRCIDTIVRHYLSERDDFDLCLLENFIGVQCLHRNGSLFGNESLATKADLQYGSFIDPRLLGEDSCN